MIKTTAHDGTSLEFDDNIIESGGMKDVYLASDKNYMVIFFRNKQDANTRDRLEQIVGKYRQTIFSQTDGNYWKDIYCWPEKIVDWNDKLGVVVPVYAKHFFFQHGSLNGDALSIKGKAKAGNWFVSPYFKYGSLCDNERGDWSSYLRICIKLARGIRKLHENGLLIAILNAETILVDPITSNVCFINILDDLLLPASSPFGHLECPDFMAPEMMWTREYAHSSPRRNLASVSTNLHGLGVFIYMYLLNRHPLRGKKVHDCDDETRDEELAMGEKALFVEHATDTSNRYDVAWVKRNNTPSRIPHLLPWMDLDQLPYKILGPYLAEEVKKAFETGLHNPMQRPTADDWETALVKTSDLLQQCANPSCTQKWFPFDNSTRPVCPFCKTPFKGILPILNLYFKQGSAFKPDNHRVMVYNGVRLYPWHVNRRVFPNEKLSPEQKKPVAYFQFHGGNWFLVNQTLQTMKDITDNKKNITLGSAVQLTDGRQILLSEEDGGRLIQVQLVQC